MINEPRGAFMSRSLTLAIFVDSDPFMDNYSPFRVPKRFLRLLNPQGALTCRSSTIAVLAYSSRFLDY